MTNFGEQSFVSNGGNGNGHANGWTFLTNHAHVLFCIAQDPEVRLRDVAVRVGITERAVQRIVTDLEEEGYLLVSKEGRRNRYQLRCESPLRHAIERHCSVQELIDLVLGPQQVPRAVAVVKEAAVG
jgi:predicted transcriptional regulator